MKIICESISTKKKKSKKKNGFRGIIRFQFSFKIAIPLRRAGPRHVRLDVREDELRERLLVAAALRLELGAHGLDAVEGDLSRGRLGSKNSVTRSGSGECFLRP